MDNADTQLRGARSQERFFKALSEETDRTPGWFHGIVPADFELDVRGIDAIAYITYPGDTRMSRVPIQIKSSWTGYHAFFEKHSRHGMKNVIVIVVKDSRTDHDLRMIIYGQLRRVRRENIRYEDFFANLMRQRLTRHAERFRKRLVRARAQPPRPYVVVQNPIPPKAPEPIQESTWRRFWKRFGF